MRTKRKIQIATDALMSAVLLLLMSYSISSELLHEIFGIAMFALFIAHHILSFPYLKALFKGKRSAVKTLKIVIDVLLTVVMLMMMFSALPLSKYVFKFLGISKFSALAGTLHLLGAYWGFVLMSLHAGFHLDFMLKKAMRSKKGKIRTAIIMAVLSAAGAIFFVSEGIYKYMFLINRFVFFDKSAFLPLFILKYALIMALFASIGYLVICLLKRRKEKI